MQLKGQLSVEHLVIVGLSLVVIIPATFLLMNFAKISSDNVVSEQVRSIGNVIDYYGQSVYNAGPDNMVTINFLLPDGVTNISIASNSLKESELIVDYRTSQGPSQASFFLNYPVIGPNDLRNESIVSRSGAVTLMINSTVDGVKLSER